MWGAGEILAGGKQQQAGECRQGNAGGRGRSWQGENSSRRGMQAGECGGQGNAGAGEDPPGRGKVRAGGQRGNKNSRVGSTERNGNTHLAPTEWWSPRQWR